MSRVLCSEDKYHFNSELHIERLISGVHTSSAKGVRPARSWPTVGREMLRQIHLPWTLIQGSAFSEDADTFVMLTFHYNNSYIQVYSVLTWQQLYKVECDSSSHVRLSSYHSDIIAMLDSEMWDIDVWHVPSARCIVRCELDAKVRSKSESCFALL